MSVNKIFHVTFFHTITQIIEIKILICSFFGHEGFPKWALWPAFYLRFNVFCWLSHFDLMLDMWDDIQAGKVV